MFCKGTLAVLWTGFECFLLTHFLFHYLPLDFKSRDKISFRGNDCNTPGVLNTKTCHVIICIVHHFMISENFDMHSLKQVYIYGYMCWLVWFESGSKSLYYFEFPKTLISAFKFTLENPISKSKQILGLSLKAKV